MSQSVIIIHTEGQDHIVVGFKSFQIDLEFLEGDWVQSFRATERPRHPLQQIALTENFVRGPLYVTQTDRITELHLKVMLAKSTSEIQSQMGHRQSLVPIIWKSDFFFKSTSGFHINKASLAIYWAEYTDNKTLVQRWDTWVKKARD